VTTRAHAIALALCLALGVARAGGVARADDTARAAWVLEPSAERAVRDALRVSDPLPDGATLSASISGDRVVVRVGPADAPALQITLVRAEDGPADAPRAAGAALLREPGPAPDALVEAILARLREAPAPIVWAAAPPPPTIPAPDPTPAPRDRDAADAIASARHAMRIGDDAAAAQRLRAIEAAPSTASQLEVALLWRQLGHADEARRALGDISGWPASERAAAQVVLDGPEGSADPVAQATPETACAYVSVVDALQLLGRADRASAAARALRTLDPACKLAWEYELQALVVHRNIDEAVKVADEALGRFGDDPNIAAAAATAFQSAGQLAKAVPLLERAGRARLGEAGALTPLLGAMVRDVPNRAGYRVELEGRVAKAPDDIVARFLLGVIRHYENDFEGSQQLLTPLDGVLTREDRLEVYLAMNDFNLGRREPALARLRKASTRPTPDPDIYYCLAEIERDTDRETARDNLDRYASLSAGDALSNPGKEERIVRLQALLRECIADGRAECEGEWEHPRFRHQGKGDWLRTAGVVGTGLAVLLLGWLLWRRRRASAGSSPR
jgi:tetratricopeptide (TPR) repeat protein